MIERLGDISLLLPSYRNVYYEISKDLTEKYKITPPIIEDINQLVVIQKLTEAGVGWSIVSESMVSDKLKKIPIMKDKFYINNACIYNKRKELSRPAKALLDICKEYTSNI